MKLLYTALLAICGCVASLHSFAQKNNDEKKILAVMRLEEQYWSNGDIDGYVSPYAPGDSRRMILSKGAAYGKENILAFYKNTGLEKKWGGWCLMAKAWREYPVSIIT